MTLLAMLGEKPMGRIIRADILSLQFQFYEEREKNSQAPDEHPSYPARPGSRGAMTFSVQRHDASKFPGNRQQLPVVGSWVDAVRKSKFE
jgi:hypothetical protein